MSPCGNDFIPAKVEGSLEWIWSHDRIKQWTEVSAEVSKRGLCIHGVKGSGKSVLASSMHLDLVARDEISAFFSFWGQSESQKKCIHLLSTLMWSLVKLLPDSQFESVAKQILLDLPVSTTNLLKSIKMAIECFQKPVYFIIDGIDESTDDWSRKSDAGLYIVSQLAKTHPNLRILLLGREPSLQAALEMFPGLEITPELLRDDIGRYIAFELQQASNITDALRGQVQTELLRRANGMFLWVKLIVTELRRCFSAAEIRATLDGSPQDLDEEYHRLFSQLSKRLGGAPVASDSSVPLHRARTLLALIVGAAEPLTLDELRHAYAVASSPRGGSNWEDYLIVNDGIIAACGDFIQISSNRIYLSHSSVQEFLTRPSAQWVAQQDIAFFRIDVIDNHRFIGTTGLDYLQSIDWGYPMCDESFMSLSSSCPFLIYSHKFTSYHILQAQTPNEDQLLRLSDFLESIQFCKWLEYMSLQILHDLAAIEHWFDLAELSCWYNTAYGDIESLSQLLRRRFAEELARRYISYGNDDRRTESWRALEALWQAFAFDGEDSFDTLIQPLQQALPENVAVLHSSQPSYTLATVGTNIESTQLDSTTSPKRRHIPSLPTSSDLVTHFSSFKMANIVLRAPREISLQRVSSRAMDVLFNGLLSAANQLPPIALISLTLYFNSLDQRSKVLKLSQMAVNKTMGTGGFEEAAALVLRGAALGYSDDKGAACYRQAKAITDNLPQKLHIEVLNFISSSVVITADFENNSVEATSLAAKLAAQLVISGASPTSGASLWESHIRRTNLWTTYRLAAFGKLCDVLLETGEPQLGLFIDLGEKALANMSPLLGSTHSSVLDMQAKQARMLHRAGRYEEAIRTWKDLALTFGRQYEGRWLETQIGQARAYWRLRQHQEAERILREVESDHTWPPLTRRKTTLSLVASFALQGRFADAKEQAARIDFVSEIPGLKISELQDDFEIIYQLHWDTRRFEDRFRDVHLSDTGASGTNLSQSLPWTEEFGWLEVPPLSNQASRDPSEPDLISRQNEKNVHSLTESPFSVSTWLKSVFVRDEEVMAGVSFKQLVGITGTLHNVRRVVEAEWLLDYLLEFDLRDALTDKDDCLAVWTLAILLRQYGDDKLDASMAMYSRSIKLASLDFELISMDIINILLSYAQTCVYGHRHAKAAGAFQQLSDAYAQMDMKVVQEVYRRLGTFYLFGREVPHSAVSMLAQAVNTAESMDDGFHRPASLAFSYTALGEAHQKLGNYAAAQRAWKNAHREVVKVEYLESLELYLNWNLSGYCSETSDGDLGGEGSMSRLPPHDAQ